MQGGLFSSTNCIVLQLLLLVLSLSSALPSIRFDHPSQDFEFAPVTPGGRANVVLVFAALADPAWGAANYLSRLQQWEGGRWSVIIDINAHEVARWHCADLINALGEVSAHISVPDLPPGEHVASCRLVQEGGHSSLEFDSPEHTISFFVRGSPLQPPPPPDTWSPLLCGACPLTFACSSTTGSTGDETAAERGAAAGKEECSGHGVCRNGACLCAGGWAGEECDHNIARNASFLPEIDPATAPSRCTKSLAWQLGESELEELLETHLPSDASRCPPLGAAAEEDVAAAVSGEEGEDGEEGEEEVYIRMLLFGPPSHGLGFNVHYVSHMLAWALRRRRIPAMVCVCASISHACASMPYAGCA